MAAAALLLVALTAVVFVRSRFEPPPRATVALQHPAAATARGTVLAELASASLSFDDARERLMLVLQARRGVLQPKTMAVVRENLRVIDRAIVQIQAALEQDPNNADLAHQLVASYQQEIRLLERATSPPAEL
jgi:septum formation topological specificity factor MinE